MLNDTIWTVDVSLADPTKTEKSKVTNRRVGPSLVGLRVSGLINGITLLQYITVLLHTGWLRKCVPNKIPVLFLLSIQTPIPTIFLCFFFQSCVCTWIPFVFLRFSYSRAFSFLCSRGSLNLHWYMLWSGFLGMIRRHPRHYRSRMIHLLMGMSKLSGQNWF